MATNSDPVDIISSSVRDSLGRIVRDAVARGIRDAMAPGADQPILLDVDEAAKKLCVGRATIRRMVERGDLEAVRCLSAVRIRARDLDEFIAGKGPRGE